jgi:hypothetical protein
MAAKAGRKIDDHESMCRRLLQGIWRLPKCGLLFGPEICSHLKMVSGEQFRTQSRSSFQVQTFDLHGLAWLPCGLLTISARYTSLPPLHQTEDCLLPRVTTPTLHQRLLPSKNVSRRPRDRILDVRFSFFVSHQLLLLLPAFHESADHDPNTCHAMALPVGPQVTYPTSPLIDVYAHLHLARFPRGSAFLCPLTSLILCINTAACLHPVRCSIAPITIFDGSVRRS